MNASGYFPRRGSCWGSIFRGPTGCSFLAHRKLGAHTQWTRFSESQLFPSPSVPTGKVLLSPDDFVVASTREELTEFKTKTSEDKHSGPWACSKFGRLDIHVSQRPKAKTALLCCGHGHHWHFWLLSFLSYLLGLWPSLPG